MAVIDSDDVMGVNLTAIGNTKGHGYQHNNADRGKLVNVYATGNGVSGTPLSGVDWFSSVGGELVGAYCVGNGNAGIEIDSLSNFMKVFACEAHDNTVTSGISLFRSRDVDIFGCDADIKLWDLAGILDVKRVTIHGGGGGRTLTLEAGACEDISTVKWRGSITDPSSVVTEAVFA